MAKRRQSHQQADMVTKKLKANMYFKIATVFTSFFIPKTREEEEQREKTELFMGENKVKHFVNIL